MEQVNPNEIEGQELLSVSDLLHVRVRPRFPIAVMHWYKQYSNPESARQGTIEYAMSLTPGLDPDTAGKWIDKLVAESNTKTEDEVTESLTFKVASE